jgi:hypothetical protein
VVISSSTGRVRAIDDQIEQLARGRVHPMRVLEYRDLWAETGQRVASSVATGSNAASNAVASSPIDGSTSVSLSRQKTGGIDDIARD